MQISKGILYISSGEKYYEEAVRSAKSCKVFNSDIPICVFTDKENVSDVFDIHEPIGSPTFSMLDKVNNIWKTPFEKTIYIDTDTLITSNIDELFSALDYVDFMATNESARGFWYSGKLGIPDPLPEFNGGVLAYKNTPEVISALKSWSKAQEETQIWLKSHLALEWVKKAGAEKWMLTLDQPSLRKVIWENKGIRVAILPEEYNALVLSGTHLWDKARIVHGRGNIEKYANQMNKYPKQNRIFFQGFGSFRPMNGLGLKASIVQLLKLVLLVVYLQYRKLKK